MQEREDAMNPNLHGLKPHLPCYQSSIMTELSPVCFFFFFLKGGRTTTILRSAEVTLTVQVCASVLKAVFVQEHLYIQQDCIAIHITQSALLDFCSYWLCAND